MLIQETLLHTNYYMKSPIGLFKIE